MQRKHQSGNMLFIILIAIILLGGLAVMLSRVSSSTDDTGSAEKDSIAAADILRYSAGVAAGVTRLVTNGCSENQISFDDNLTTTGGYENPNTVPGNTCHVFLESGAGLRKRSADPKWLDTTQSSSVAYGDIYFHAMSVVNIGSNGNPSGFDLMLWIPYIKKDICTQINRNLGVSTIPTDQGINISTGNYSSRRFKGTYSTGMTQLGDDVVGSPIIGRKALCIQATTVPVANTYHFYQILLVR